jgi:precorrin-3B synthase
VVRLLGVIAAHGATARAADILRRQGPAPFRAVVEGSIEPAYAPPARPVCEAMGTHPLREGFHALGVAPAFGQADADALAQLAGLAGELGARSLNAAPGRVLLISGLTRPQALALALRAERLGFIVRPDDPRRRITACPGRPACASGFIAARALAGEIAQRLPQLRSEIHVSGCDKGCAHPAPAALTVVGSERGCGIVRCGSARAIPRGYVEPADLVAEVVRAMPPEEARRG